MKLCIENVSLSTSEDEIRELFSLYGAVERVYITRDELSSASEIVYVTMSTADERELAIASLNGSNFKDRQIKVSEIDDNDSSSSDIW